MPILIPICIFIAAKATRSQSTITIDNLNPTIAVSPNLWGIFFEEINHAGEGGLLAQQIQNPRFHTVKGNVEAWKLSPGASVAIKGLDGHLHLLQGSTATNNGFWGISLHAGAEYKLTFDIKTEFGSRLSASFWSANSKSSAVNIPISINHGQKIITKTFRSPVTGHDLSFKLQCLAGDASVSFVSLQPLKTFMNHGMRLDLAKEVAAIHPSFVRFPGGCYVEGVRTVKNRFDWSTTITQPWHRPGHLDDIWGYWSSDDLGFYEYLQWCADMRAKPLFVVNCGMAVNETDPLSKDHYLLESALNSLHFANDPDATAWGMKRKAMGHAAPFNIRYVEIGNENGIWSGQSAYPSHYLYFYNAIKKEFPYIKCIANVRGPYPMDIVDDHVYSSPGWFWRNDNEYATFPRTEPKVYVGEYAVTRDCGKGNLRAALAEAAYMTGLEKNSDLVRMASYAPLFVNVNNQVWNPDAIRFNNHQSFGTASYWVQQMFSENRIVRIIPVKFPNFPSKGPAEPKTIEVGVGTWATQAEFSNLKVTIGSQSVAVPLKSSSELGGVWTKSGVDPAMLSQTSPSTPALAFFNLKQASNHYSFDLDAKKIGGAEGFLVIVKGVAKRDEKWKFLWWNIGGWGNNQIGVEKTSHGSRAVITSRKPFHIDSNKVYHIQVQVNGESLKLFVNGKWVQSATDSTPSFFAADAGFTLHHHVLLRVVNGDSVSRTVNLAFAKKLGTGSMEAIETILTSRHLDDENSFKDPLKVSPKVRKVLIDAKNPQLKVPARSLVFLKFLAK